MEIEDKIMKKFKDKKIETKIEEEKFSNKRGHYMEITQKLEILNLDDFPQDIRETICQIIKRPMNNGKEFLFKEIMCYITKQGISFEGVLDNENKVYAFKNIQIRISGITDMRVKTDNITIENDVVFDVGNETLICRLRNEKISCTLFETGNDFVSSFEDATELDKKVLNSFDTTKIYGKNKKIRSNPETGKLYIR